MFTTFNQILKDEPPKAFTRQVKEYLKANQYGRDDPISIVCILDFAGLSSALLALGSVQGHDREIHLFGVSCAREANTVLQNRILTEALDIARQYALGYASISQLNEMRSAVIRYSQQMAYTNKFELHALKAVIYATHTDLRYVSQVATHASMAMIFHGYDSFRETLVYQEQQLRMLCSKEEFELAQAA
jgi:hypothetical protein